MIFYVRSRSYDGSGSWTDRLPAGLRGLTEGRQVLSSSGTCEEPPPIRGRAKDIATQCGILALSVRTTGCRLATDNKKGAQYRPFLLVSSNRPRVAQHRCVSGV